MLFQTVCLLSLNKNSMCNHIALQAVEPDKSSDGYLDNLHTERASRRTFFYKKKGSMTVEAALVFPIFIFAMTALLYLFFLAQLRVEVGRALTDTAKELSWAAFYAEDTGSLAPSALAYLYTGVDLDDYLEGRAALNIVDGGSDGISLIGTNYDDDTCVLTLVASYSVVMPPWLGWFNDVDVVQTRAVRGWSGFTGRDSYSSVTDSDIVYVTNYGTVYHQDLSCRYLNLSIETTTLSEVSSLRNDDGSKYYPCEVCWEGGSETVYITDSGTRYHQSLSCSSLVRGINTMLLTEAVAAGYGACSVCGGG